jgi:hypothetical protein
MKLDGATIAIEPRPIGACIDLSVLLAGHYWRQLLGLTLWFAVPSCALTYWLASFLDAALWCGLLLFFGISPFLGAAIVIGIGHRAFGDPFTVMATLRAMLPHFVRLGCLLLLVRIAVGVMGLMCLVPAVFPAAYYGFVTEIFLLEQTWGNKLMRRNAELMRGVFFDLALRFVLIVLFFGCLAIALFALLDLALRTFLGVQVLAERVTMEFFIEDLSYLLFHDPRVVTLLCCSLWLVYPLGRLAWFLCYLDDRIRKEAWDVELDFRIEAQRLTRAQEYLA